MEEFPLRWPLGYPVTNASEPNYNFKAWTIPDARKELIRELGLLGAENFVITRNNDKRKDGIQYSAENMKKIAKGVAVYFVLNGEQKVLCCDAWDNWADNMHSISLTINALRGMERWGVSNIMKGTTSGLKEIPVQIKRDTWTVLGLKEKPPAWFHVESAYKAQALKVHPDRPGGSHDSFVELQEAYQEAKRLFV